MEGEQMSGHVVSYCMHFWSVPYPLMMITWGNYWKKLKEVSFTSHILFHLKFRIYSGAWLLLIPTKEWRSVQFSYITSLLSFLYSDHSFRTHLPLLWKSNHIYLFFCTSSDVLKNIRPHVEFNHWKSCRAYFSSHTHSTHFSFFSFCSFFTKILLWTPCAVYPLSISGVGRVSFPLSSFTAAVTKSEKTSHSDVEMGTVCHAIRVFRNTWEEERESQKKMRWGELGGYQHQHAPCDGGCCRRGGCIKRGRKISKGSYGCSEWMSYSLMGKCCEEKEDDHHQNHDDDDVPFALEFSPWFPIHGCCSFFLFFLVSLLPFLVLMHHHHHITMILLLLLLFLICFLLFLFWRISFVQ